MKTPDVNRATFALIVLFLCVGFGRQVGGVVERKEPMKALLLNGLLIPRFF
jgi:hypothetical protein